jgi:hypothetical protein
MTYRSVFLGVVALMALTFGTPSYAGSIYLTQAVFFNAGPPAQDFEATFGGTGGTISDITVFNPVTGATSSVTGGGNSITIDFTPSIGSFQVLDISFENTFSGNVTFTSGEWTYASNPPVSTGPPVLLETMQVVPEPATITLFGIAAACIVAVSYRRVWKRIA